MKHNQTFSMDSFYSEALYLWSIKTKEKKSQIINRLIKENCPKDILDSVKENIINKEK